MLGREASVGDRGGGPCRWDEMVPEPWDSKYVVFAAHSTRRFSLPTSTFFWRFHTFFGLQPHHLSANAVLQLSSFVAFCEGYIGILSTMDLSSRMFYLQPQTVNDDMSAYGAATVYFQEADGFPRLLLLESAAKK